MLKISIILAHPGKNSFNHAIATTAVETARRNGHQICFHDLCAEKFDPLLPAAEIPDGVPLPGEIEAHCNEIALADGIIIVHPNWWGQPPAIMKGWIDRVLRDGVAYRFLEGDGGEGIPLGLLKARTAMVFNTSNTSAEREMRVFGDPLQNTWEKCIFEFCGVPGFYRKMFRILCTSTPEQRKAWLEEVEQAVANVFPKE